MTGRGEKCKFDTSTDASPLPPAIETRPYAREGDRPRGTMEAVYRNSGRFFFVYPLRDCLVCCCFTLAGTIPFGSAFRVT